MFLCKNWRSATRPRPLVFGEELIGFQEPAVVREQHAVLGSWFGGDSAGDFAPDGGDPVAIVGVAFPDESVGAKDSGKEVALGFAAFEEWVDFESFQGEDDDVIETDRLAD